MATPSYDALQQLASVAYAGGSRLNAITRDGAGRTVGLEWTFPGSATITDTVVRSQSGRVVRDSLVRGAENFVSTYGYDGAGRLTSASIPGHQLSYEFAASGGCGVNTAAGASGNRTRLVDVFTPAGSSVSQTMTTNYCYDWADRLTSSTVTNPVSGAHEVADGLAAGQVVYNARGDITTLGGITIAYDAGGRHAGMTYSDGTTVTVARDATGRVVARTVDPAGSQPASTTKFLHAGSSDSPWGSVSAAGDLTRQVSLPGGVNIEASASGMSWSYPGILGHSVASGNGTSTGALRLYDPFGQPLDPATRAIGTVSSDDQGLNGQKTGWHQGGQKLAHTAGQATIIEMGARLYVPSLGRFLQVDPVEGGVDNDYVWPTDPVNKQDLTGEFALPLVPVIAIIVAVLLIVAYIASKHLVGLPPIRISMPSLPEREPASSSRSSARAVVVPRPQATTWRNNVPYKVYEIKSTVTNETWKYGITSGAPWEARPQAQYGDCARYFGQPCTHQFKADVTGYYHAGASHIVVSLPTGSSSSLT